MGDSNHPGSKSFNLLMENGKIQKKLKDLKRKIENRYSFKRVVMVLMIAVIATLLLGTYKINEIKTRSYTVYYGDEEVGTVRKKEEALKVIEDIKTILSNTYDSEIVLGKDIRFENTHAKDESLVSAKELKSNIQSNMTFLVSGYELLVDDKEVGFCKSKEELEDILQTIKKPYLNTTNENSDIIDVSFVEDVKIKQKDIPLNKINDKEELLQYIQTGTEEEKIHVVEVGESLWTIAEIYDMSVEELVKANPDKNPEKLQIGDEVKLMVPKSLITVATIEEVEYTDEVDYEVKIEYDDDMYKTQSDVKVKGSEGETKYFSRITKHNGVKVEEDILKEEVIKEPVDELVVKGTKELPKTAATGVFLMPTRGSLSSRYGMRNGRMHYGLDIATRTGTPIKAADGGKVVYAGWKGSYGYMVEINHENGYTTRYAHCSSMDVKVGQRVYKGQVIARVGNTGRSTGPHLHFEVLKNGRNRNPASYVY
ncbi:peptidoglycan DD-metalloendopeptidase family protein [Schnuerera sp. xch1]|uniref:M23 family metallopeptidase n=1 Tax=Schnuerera sp. xch1 TaxID=2874283 RepID=UPI001CBC1F6B|nr:M23 family metallopeptidase [Schnuerera sp. xch1]MBZ2175680.1 peptidoglycan DD-metalloendopeptidase family protein [Schnuerera sp. xch1]